MGFPGSRRIRRIFCVMKLFAKYYGEWNPRKGDFRWMSLASAGQYFNIPEQNTHRATDDSVFDQTCPGEDGRGIVDLEGILKYLRLIGLIVLLAVVCSACQSGEPDVVVVTSEDSS